MFDYAKTAADRGLKVIIAGAGGAAHLPGMTASLTPLPVIGVPIKSSNSIDGWDSLLSIVQMPNGIPVATVAINAAKNAGILAAKILGASDVALRAELLKYMESMKETVLEGAEKVAINKL
jgi:5-(carboxyamino)imidazole ribonucleotide mutase